MRTQKDLFTVMYAIEYDGWVKIPATHIRLGFLSSYMRGTYEINITSPIYYNLVRILDKNKKVVFFDYIRSLYDYNKMKKKLGWK
jgi:hypothetical protein